MLLLLGRVILLQRARLEVAHPQLVLVRAQRRLELGRGPPDRFVVILRPPLRLLFWPLPLVHREVHLLRQLTGTSAGFSLLMEPQEGEEVLVLWLPPLLRLLRLLVLLLLVLLPLGEELEVVCHPNP